MGDLCKISWKKVGDILDHISTVEPHFLHHKPQCIPGIVNLDYKFHGLSCFWGFHMFKKVQNQSRKTFVIRLPKFHSVNMARKCHQWASFSIVKWFFEHYSFGSLTTDVFIDWFRNFSCISMPQKQESPWNFWSRLKIPRTHCVRSFPPFSTMSSSIARCVRAMEDYLLWS